MTEKNEQSKFPTIFLVAVACVLIGGFIGAITNMINGAVSPYYFKTIMRWDFEGIWAASVAQGIFEGLLYGVFFAIVFATGFGIVTKGKAGFSFALKQLSKIIVVVFTFWTIGGLLAMFLAAISPDFYKGHFRDAPTETIEMLKFAWVGGSISGATIGGLLTAILGIVMTKNNWAKELETK